MLLKRKAMRVAIFSLALITVLSACGTGLAASPAPASRQQADAITPAAEVAGQQATAQSQTGPTSAAANLKINLNTASADEFLAIPGVGSRMVREFQEYRPYTSILQFRREIGKYVDEAQVAEYEKYVYVPVSANESDAATLQQIAGLDDSEAQALIDARPFASNADFLTAMAAYVSESELAAAKALTGE
jgi:DNA uptake protein ComE-like DNA-binding protein